MINYKNILIILTLMLTNSPALFATDPLSEAIKRHHASLIYTPKTPRAYVLLMPVAGALLGGALGYTRMAIVNYRNPNTKISLGHYKSTGTDRATDKQLMPFMVEPLTGLAIGLLVGSGIMGYLAFKQEINRKRSIMVSYFKKSPEELRDLLPAPVCDLLEPYRGKTDLTFGQVAELSYQIMKVCTA